jgi:hypothetical protein
MFIQQISVLNILNMLHNLSFFFSSKRRLFHNATLFGFCAIHILNTECAKILKKIPAPKGKPDIHFKDAFEILGLAGPNIKPPPPKGNVSELV